MSKNAVFAESAQPQGSGTFQYFDVSKIDIDPATNGRFAGHDEDEVRTLALDILCQSKVHNGRLFHGQISPVTVSRLADGTPFLVAGFGRCGAIDYVNANVEDAEINTHLRRLGLLNDAGELSKPFPVKAILAPQMTAEELEDYNMAENADRKDLSPMDWAIHVGRLTKRGWTDGAIATHISKYTPNGRASVTPAWVAKMRYLLELSPEVQKAVHRREIPIDRAVEMWRNARDITVADPTADGGERKPTIEEIHEEMDKTLGSVTDKDGKVDTAALREKNRQQNAKRGSKATLTIAEAVAVCEKGIEQGSKNATVIYNWLKGKITEADFLSWLADSIDESEVPEAAETGKRARRGQSGRKGAGAGGSKAGSQVDLGVVAKNVKNTAASPATDPVTGQRMPPRAKKQPRGSKSKEAPAGEVTNTAHEESFAEEAASVE